MMRLAHRPIGRRYQLRRWANKRTNIFVDVGHGMDYRSTTELRRLVLSRDPLIRWCGIPGPSDELPLCNPG